MTRAATHESLKLRAPRATSLHLSRSKSKASVNVDSDRRNAVTTVTIVVRGNDLTPGGRGGVHLRQRIETIVVGILESPRPVAKLERLAQRAIQTTPIDAPDRVRAKSPKSSISVNSADGLWEELEHHANELSASIAPVAKDCFERGLDALSKRLWEESPRAVLAELSKTYQQRFEGSTKQWSLRVSRETYLEAVMLAQEQGISLSQLACICVTSGLESHAVA